MRQVLNISIPESLADITTDQLIRYIKEDDISVAKTFSIFCQIPMEVLRLMDNNTVHYIYEQIGHALNKSEGIKPTFIFEHKGIEYGMIPKLEDMTFGEFVDLDTFITPAFEGEIKHEDAFRFMATLYRPIVASSGNTYKIEEYTAKEDWMIFKDVPANIYIGAINFFLLLREESLKATLPYIREVVAAAEGLNLEGSGDGMEALSALQQVITAQKMRSQNLEFWKHLPNLNLMLN